MAADLGAWLVFEDESGQGLRPPVGLTWGRRGQTPVVKVTGGSNNPSAISAIGDREALRAQVGCVHGSVRLAERATSTIDGFLSLDGRARRYDRTALTVRQPQGLRRD